MADGAPLFVIRDANCETLTLRSPKTAGSNEELSRGMGNILGVLSACDCSDPGRAFSVSGHGIFGRIWATPSGKT